MDAAIKNRPENDFRAILNMVGEEGLEPSKPYGG
jgi:hypothetical protein